MGTVEICSALFKHGMGSLEKDPGADIPIEATPEEMRRKVESMVTDNKRVMALQLVSAMGL